MATKQEKIQEFLTSAGALTEGETYVFAAKAMPLGGISDFSKSSSLYMFGAIGAIAATVKENRAPVPTDIEAKLKKGAYLALTSHHLYLVSLGGMSSSPREIAAVIDRSSIHGVEMGTTRVSMVKIPTLTLKLGPEESLGFEFAKPDAKDAERLFQLLQ